MFFGITLAIRDTQANNRKNCVKIKKGVNMAIFLLSASIEDAKGHIRPINVPVPRGALTLAGITSYWQEALTRLDLIIDGRLIGAGVQVEIALPGGQKANAVAGSDVQEGANFLYTAAGTTYKHGIRIPALKQALFVGEGVDISDGDFVSWNALLTAGFDPGSGLVSASDKYENDLLSLSSAKKTFRK